jgi:hypothetical protein
MIGFLEKLESNTDSVYRIIFTPHFLFLIYHTCNVLQRIDYVEYIKLLSERVGGVDSMKLVEYCIIYVHEIVPNLFAIQVYHLNL